MCKLSVDQPWVPHVYLKYLVNVILSIVSSLFRVLGEVLGGGPVHASDDGVVSLIGLERHHVDGAEFFLLEFLHLVLVDDFGGER